MMETNSLIGQDKGNAAVVIFSGGFLVMGTAYLLPDKWRKVALGYYIGDKGKTVSHNKKIKDGL